MTDLLESIAIDLHMPLDLVQHAAKHAPTRVKRFLIRKRNGGSREIVQPSIALKPILAWIDVNLLSALPVHSIASAFRPCKSILENASAHKYSLYSVRVDIKSFYPSIMRVDFERILVNNKKLFSVQLLTPNNVQALSRLCFDAHGSLPIGYSTSPAIANAVMYEIDSTLVRLISNKSDFGNAVLTRYADDFVFSTDKVGACKKFVEAITSVFASTSSPVLRINPDKTRFMSRAGGSTIVTGLRVNNQGNVVVHADYRDHVRLLLKLYRSGTLRVDEVPKLVGHLAHIQHVDPSLFTKLSFRYFREIEHLRGGRATVENVTNSS